MLTHFYCLEKWKRYTSPMYPMANELTCLDFSYFRLYVTFPQSQQELISNTPAVQFRYLADFLLQSVSLTIINQSGGETIILASKCDRSDNL